MAIYINLRGIGDYDNNFIFIFSGLIEFLLRTLPLLDGCRHIIVTVHVSIRGLLSLFYSAA
jgi:hypothetical protein